MGAAPIPIDAIDAVGRASELVAHNARPGDNAEYF